MKPKFHFTIIFLLVAGHLSQAQWQLVEDFSGNLDKWVLSDPNQNCESIEPNYCDGVRQIVDDPVNGGNPVGLFKAAADNVVVNWTASNVIALPESVTDDRIFSVYFRFAISDFRQNSVWGVMSKPAEEVSNDYGAYESILAITPLLAGNLQIRDFDQYVQATGDPLQNQQWYEVWMVHDNTDLSYDLYMKGSAESEYPVQTLVWEGALYRAGLGEAYSFAILQSTGGASNPGGNSALYIDDIYVDTAGENLTMATSNTNTGDTWAGYPVLPSGDTDTDAFMGWLSVGSKPFTDYVWSYAFNSWVYLPEGNVSTNGAWTYVLK